MNAKQIEVILGGLFHDIGNILYTHNVGISNCEEGHRFIKDAGIDNESILEQLKFQQYNILKEANIAEDSLAYITCWANSIVSRRSPEEHSKNTEEKEKYKQ